MFLGIGSDNFGFTVGWDGKEEILREALLVAENARNVRRKGGGGDTSLARQAGAFLEGCGETEAAKEVYAAIAVAETVEANPAAVADHQKGLEEGLEASFRLWGYR